MPPAACLQYYPLSSNSLPSCGNFDHEKWVKWLQQLGKPSQIEVALLWFLEPDAISRGESMMSPYIPQTIYSSGIDKLPNEILVMILDSSIDLKVPRLILQLVNKYWYNSMQAPNLWNNMTLELTMDGRYMFISNRLVYLRRCLQRSSSVTLRVKILLEEGNTHQTPLIPFELILPRCGTKNWASLLITLNHLRSDASPSLVRLKVDNIFLPSLKSITLLAHKFGVFELSCKNAPKPETPTPFHRIERLEPLFDGRLLADLTSLRTFGACAEAVSTLSSCLNLEKFHLTMKLSDYTTMGCSIKFPPTVMLPTMSTTTLRGLQLKRVQHLTIEELTPDLFPHEISIPFPELQVLVIEKSDFRSLIYISAPKLQELYIGSQYVRNEDHATDAADMITLFRYLPHYIKVAPKLLQTRLPMTTEATMLLLEMWPQLEQASIRLVGWFEWEWLVEGLIKRKRVRGVALKMPWKYCPYLRWLKLVIDDPVKERGEWENRAKAILRGREDSPLTCVSWTFGGSLETVLNREDLDAESGAQRLSASSTACKSGVRMTSKQIINEDSGNRLLVHSSVQYLAPPRYAAQISEARGIYRLPLELLVEIFKAWLDLGVARATIACLNKYCSAALVSSPALWKHITLWLSTDRGNIRTSRMPYLKRRLELSQRHPLSVRLDSDSRKRVPEYDTLTLRSVLHQCDTSRWESLTINHDGWGGEVLKEFKFPSLKSLSFIQAPNRPDMSFPSAIFAALLQSRPKIEEIILPEAIYVPASFFQSSILHSLRVASTSALVVSKLPSPSSLQALHITGCFSNLHLKDIELPPTVSLPLCSTHILKELRLERTQHLIIKSLKGTIVSENVTIKCQELRSLSVIESGFPHWSTSQHLDSPTYAWA